ncbi:MAG: hypothetical protein ACQGTM_15425 [bacterium]
MNIMQKLTSRKFWLALAGLIVGVLALFQVDANTVTQISGVVMSLGSVIAYIVGEGMVDAAAAGTGDTGTPSIPQYTAPVIGTVDPAPAAGTPTGADQAAKVKQDTALSGEGAVASDTTGAE